MIKENIVFPSFYEAAVFTYFKHFALDCPLSHMLQR